MNAKKPSEHFQDEVNASAARTANPRTKIMDSRGFDSSIILTLRGGIIMSIRDFPESLSSNVSRDNVSREIGRSCID